MQEIYPLKNLHLAARYRTNIDDLQDILYKNSNMLTKSDFSYKILQKIAKSHT